jgi:D-3-phosphoglycerate dehydrogenase / 2-oxoglutarate reductase
MPKVLITEKVDERCLQILSKMKLDYDLKPEIYRDQQRLDEALASGGYQAVIFRSGTNLRNRGTIEAAKKGGVIYLARAGTDPSNVDMWAATEAGIHVLTAAGANAISAAEHTIALMLALSKNIARQDKAMREGNFDRELQGVEIAGKTIGIIGMGRVGREVAKRVIGFTENVIGYDPLISEEAMKGLGVRQVSLEELFKTSDYITVHIPGNEKTMNLIGEKEIAMMKPKGVRLLNVARGGIINEKALYDALKSGRIAGAALDVFVNEPYEGELLTLDNIVVTPHGGAATPEAQQNVGEWIAERTGNAVLNGNTSYSANAFSIKTKPYRIVSYLLGIIQSDLMNGNLLKAGIGAHAPINPSIDNEMMESGFAYGFLSARKNDVTLENAIKIGNLKISQEPAPRNNYDNAVMAKVESSNGIRTLEGALLSGKPFLLGIDDLQFEGAAELGQNFSFFTYEDKPGQVNRITDPIKQSNINIATVGMGRNRPGGTAIFALNTDGPIPPDVLKSAADAVNAYEARTFYLPSK